MYMSNVGALGHPWRELPYKNHRGACQKLWKEPIRGANILFVGIAFFPPLRRTNSKKHIIYCHIFPAQYPVKRDHRSSCRGPYEPEHSKRYQNCLSFKVHVHLAPPVPAPSWRTGYVTIELHLTKLLFLLLSLSLCYQLFYVNCAFYTK